MTNNKLMVLDNKTALTDGVYTGVWSGWSVVLDETGLELESTQGIRGMRPVMVRVESGKITVEG